MYCNYYGFSQKPFDVTPNPQFLFLTPDHQEILASIVYGVRERRGFITIIGEVGTGKTTLLNAAIDRMDKKTQVAFIFNTDVTFDEMLNMALYEWRLTDGKEKLSKFDAIRHLNRFAIEQSSKGGNVVLIVDEAQNLDSSAMENLRLLSNLETRRHKLIQMILSGQPELNAKLSRYELRQFAQRISLKRCISPLSEKDTYGYLRHRIKVVQESGVFPFNSQAQRLIWEYSKGVPRKINILCDNAFLIGYALKKKTIDEAVVWEAARDLEWLRSSELKASSDISLPKSTGLTWVEPRPAGRSFKLKIAMLMAGILILAGILFLYGREFQMAKPADYLSSTNGAAFKTLHFEQGKGNVKTSRHEISEPANMKSKIIIRKVPKQNPYPKQVRQMRMHQPHPMAISRRMKTKRSNLIIPDNDTESVKQGAVLNPKVPLGAQDINREKHDFSVPVIRLDNREKSAHVESGKEEIPSRNVKINKGDTLFDIISRELGRYNDRILTKVLRENPNIEDPNKIFVGQEIRLPMVKEYGNKYNQ